MSTPSEQRQERIALLRRQEDRKRRLSNFLHSLSNIAGQPISEGDVLSVEETDRTWSQIHKNEELQQASLSVSFPYRDKEKLTAVFKSLESTLRGQKQYFTTHKFYGSCFLFINTSFCIDNYEKLIEYDGDTFYIYDKEMQNGIWVDTSEHHWRDQEEYLWTYELRVRGLEWMDKVFEAYRRVITKS